ncbi:MAG TPA: hypothetical protein K8V74_06905 [Brevibacterium epidermidis]|uniref:Uncharacterized protein n=1 Tax=Brevibacterium epidermidis TaxID=1698 RepID=A0A9D2UMF6_BREEP|nr:hypothetical protein [Brevibacterium epidermidis]
MGDDLTVENADERQSLVPIAGRAQGIDKLGLVDLKAAAVNAWIASMSPDASGRMVN